MTQDGIHELERDLFTAYLETMKHTLNARQPAARAALFDALSDFAIGRGALERDGKRKRGE